MDRRSVIGLLASAPVAAAFRWAPDSVREAAARAREAPGRGAPQQAEGGAVFNSLRAFTAAGSFSSKLGVQNLRYMGNTSVAEWKRCPPEALDKLGVRYVE